LRSFLGGTDPERGTTFDGLSSWVVWLGLCQLQVFGGNAEFARARWTLCECLMGDAAAAVAQCPKLPIPQGSLERLPRRRRL
jgi:hypothetical protein